MRCLFTFFGNERVIESIIATARHLRQTFAGNIRPEAVAQSVEPVSRRAHCKSLSYSLIS